MDVETRAYYHEGQNGDIKLHHIKVTGGDFVARFADRLEGALYGINSPLVLHRGHDGGCVFRKGDDLYIVLIGKDTLDENERTAVGIFLNLIKGTKPPEFSQDSFEAIRSQIVLGC